MKFTAHKLFFAWDYDKEENWLNEMAAKGMHLTGVGLCKYVFEEGEPGAYQYHLEWLKNWPAHPESISYIRFLENMGVEHVGCFKKWLYLRQRTHSDIPFAPQLDEQISHLKRLLCLIAVLVPVLLFGTFSLYTSFRLSRGAVMAFPAIMALFYVCLWACIAYGAVKLVRAYRRLKKERAVRE